MTVGDGLELSANLIGRAEPLHGSVDGFLRGHAATHLSRDLGLEMSDEVRSGLVPKLLR